MSNRGHTRTVYSTAAGRICPTCGWPENNCQCSSRREEPVPARPVARLRLEKKARGGKTVTVVDGLPRNTAFLKELSQELKRACGTGGAVFETGVEVQGDMRERVRDLLLERDSKEVGAILDGFVGADPNALVVVNSGASPQILDSAAQLLRGETRFPGSCSRFRRAPRARPNHCLLYQRD